MIDYAQTGLDIQYAMMDNAKRHNNTTGKDHILWGGFKVTTADGIAVPKRGRITATFMSVSQDVKQGFDVKTDGWFHLPGGENVPLLRTWYDERYEDMVSYPYLSRDGWIWFWNVYVCTWPNGETTKEKWTGNAGFWVEPTGANERIYHCSPGMIEKPNFESLLVKVEISSSE